MRISRREFLKLGLAGGAMLAFPFGASACSSLSDAPMGNLLRSMARLPESFRTPCRCRRCCSPRAPTPKQTTTR